MKDSWLHQYNELKKKIKGSELRLIMITDPQELAAIIGVHVPLPARLL